MCDVKKVSETQDMGYIGESEFVPWATKAGFYPTKIIPDHGIDYLCQVKGDKTSGKASSTMPGRVFLATVRSTEEDGQKVVLSRSDANLILSNTLIVLVMVRRAPIGKAGQVSIRFGDESFIRELHLFLCSTADSHSIRFSDSCTDLAAIRYNVERLFHRSYQDRLSHLKVELRLGAVLKVLRLHVVHDGHGGYSVIISSNFLDQFDVTAPRAQDQLHQAVFGRSDLLEQRLARLPLHPKVRDVLKDLPRPILIGGPLLTASGHTEIEATNSHGSIRATFERRSLNEWFGYSHDSGVFIRFSKAVKAGNQHVHRVETDADPEMHVERLCAADIAPFLKCCTGDNATIRVCGANIELSADMISGLCSLGWLVTYIEGLTSWSFVTTVGWRVADVEEEDLHSLAFLNDLHVNHGMLDGFGFAFGHVPFDQLMKLPVDMDLPVCMNLRKRGIVCWLTGKGSLFKEVTSGSLVGLQLTQIESLRFQDVEKPFPTDGFPRLKVIPGWPAIPFHDNKVIYRGDEDWGVALVCNRTQVGARDEFV